MRMVGIAVVLLLSVSVLAATQQFQLIAAANAMSGNTELQQLLGAKAIVVVQSESERAFVQWNGNTKSFTQVSGGNPDFTIKATPEAIRSLVNAEDKGQAVQCLIAQKAVVISAADFSKQAAIKAAMAAYVKCTPRTYYFNKNQQKYEGDAKSFGLFFARPPGALARNPGLIYDTVSKSPNAVGPWNIFKINPGLIGPNDILRLNPGLVGPADMAIINPNLHGPAEFAHVMGIGAHSRSAQFLRERGLVDMGRFDPLNRWGNRR